MICEKSRVINADLVKGSPAISDNGETFDDSKGLFHILSVNWGL